MSWSNELYLDLDLIFASLRCSCRVTLRLPYLVLAHYDQRPSATSFYLVLSQLFRNSYQLKFSSNSMMAMTAHYHLGLGYGRTC